MGEKAAQLPFLGDQDVMRPDLIAFLQLGFDGIAGPPWEIFSVARTGGAGGSCLFIFVTDCQTLDKRCRGHRGAGEAHLVNKARARERAGTWAPPT